MVISCDNNYYRRLIMEIIELSAEARLHFAKILKELNETHIITEEYEDEDEIEDTKDEHQPN